MKENDKRLICSEDKKRALKQAKLKTKARRTRQVVKTFECKVKTSKLNARQKNELEKIFIEAKWFYNHVLSLKFEQECKLCNINSTNIKSVVHFSKDNEEIESELQLLSSQEKQSIIQRMISNEKAIKTLTKRGHQKGGKLKFKSDVNCIPLKQNNYTHQFKSLHKVRIAGISGKLFVNGAHQFLDIPGVEIANANLVKKANGYFLYITTYWSKEAINRERKDGQQKNSKVIGIDFGCMTNLTLSDERKINIQIEESERLKRMQRKASKQKKRSNNQMKTYNIINREYQKIIDKKQDLANKFVHEMKAYDKVIIQDEQLSNWHRNGHGKKVQHSCMGTVKAKLKQQLNVVVLDKFIPTTKWCSCGFINNIIEQSDRTLTCPKCGKVEDRDIHSAKNMVEIWDLVSKKNFVPVGCREVKLVDFRTAAGIGTKDAEQQVQENEARRYSVFS